MCIDVEYVVDWEHNVLFFYFLNVVHLFVMLAEQSLVSPAHS
jgi:hypothetical protein